MASKALIGIFCALALAGCSGTTGGLTSLMSSVKAEKPVPDTKVRQAALETVEGRQMIGKRYKVNGVWYTPRADDDYDKVGKASWYGPGFHGKKTANGEIFDENKLTAAHPTLPLPSYVRVTNKSNGKALVLRLNDRGPFRKSRIIDVSKRAAQDLGFKNAGHARVRVEYLGPAPRKGGDRETLMAAKKFGTTSKKRGGLRNLIPSFNRDVDTDDEAVEVRLAAAEEPTRTTRRRRSIPGIPQAEVTRVATAPTASTRRVSAVSAYRSQAPQEEDPITPLLQMAAAQDAPVSVSEAVETQPLERAPATTPPETKKKLPPSVERVGGAFAMFDTTQ